MSISEIIRANGVMFTIIFTALSLASVAVVVWRWIANLRAKVDIDGFVQQVEAQLAAGGGQAAFALCEREAVESRKLVPKLFYAAFKDGHRGKVAARDAIADCIETEIVPSLHRLLPVILLFAKLAPMLGLLGTVWGMIGAFKTIAGATKVDPSALADDIGMALYTTAEGLLIAIPLIFFYTLFLERVHRTELELGRAAQAALQMLPRVYGKAA